jgi:hypothetical protein
MQAVSDGVPIDSAVELVKQFDKSLSLVIRHRREWQAIYHRAVDFSHDKVKNSLTLSLDHRRSFQA